MFGLAAMFAQPALLTSARAGVAIGSDVRLKDGLDNRNPLAGAIDIHHHIVPEDYVAALQRAKVFSVGRVPFPSWSEDRFLEGIEALQISKAVLSVSSPGVYFGDPGLARELARSVNETAAGLKQRHPEKVGGFATVPLPDVADAIAETRYALDVLGLDGIILLSNYGGHYAGDPQFDEFLQYLNERQVTVFVHPTLPFGVQAPPGHMPAPLLEFVFETTRLAANLIYSGALDKFDRISFILAHLGGTLPYVAWRLRLLDLSSRNVYREFRARSPQGVLTYLKKFYYDTALSAGPNSLNAALELVGSDRLLFGSDFPFAPMNFIEETSAALVTSPRLSPAELKKIGRGNAIRLLKSPSGESKVPIT